MHLVVAATPEFSKNSTKNGITACKLLPTLLLQRIIIAQAQIRRAAFQDNKAAEHRVY